MVKSRCPRNPRAQDPASRFYKQCKSLFLRSEIQGLLVFKGKGKWNCHLGMPRSWIYIINEQDTTKKPQTWNHGIIRSPELDRTQQNPGTLSCFLQEKPRIKHCSLAGKGQTLPWAGADCSWCQQSQDLLLPATVTGNGILSPAARKSWFVPTAKTEQ